MGVNFLNGQPSHRPPVKKKTTPYTSEVFFFPDDIETYYPGYDS